MLPFVYQGNNKVKDRNKAIPSTVGLSANQVGIGLSIAVVDLAIDRKSFNDLHLLVNPKIIWRSKSVESPDGGYANLENTRGYITSSKRVKVSALDRSDNKIFLDLSGCPPVLLHHEIDHLNGRLFIDHLPDSKHAFLVKKVNS